MTDLSDSAKLVYKLIARGKLRAVFVSTRQAQGGVTPS